MSKLDCPVAVDDRFRGIDGVGVALYGAGLACAAEMLTDRFYRVRDDAVREERLVTANARRWVRSLMPHTVALAEQAPGVWGARDVFRLGQAHFNRHRRVLRLRAPSPMGIVHWGYPLPLRIAGWINVYTVHDTIPLDHPDLTAINGGRHRRLLRAIFAQADAIATVSEASRRDILRAFPDLATVVVNCSAAVNVTGAASVPPAGLQADAYFAVTGTIECRKNIGAIIEAYHRSGAAVPLVFAGPDGDATETLAAHLSSRIIRLPFLARPNLLALIAGARGLLMPSLAEGFGLPVIEAMRLGTPVLTSRGGALGEVAGSAALLVDPRDPADMASAIRRLEQDAALRENLARAGRRNAQRFTAQHLAAALCDLYSRCLDQIHRRQS